MPASASSRSGSNAKMALRTPAERGQCRHGGSREKAQGMGSTAKRANAPFTRCALLHRWPAARASTGGLSCHPSSGVVRAAYMASSSAYHDSLDLRQTAATMTLTAPLQPQPWDQSVTGLMALRIKDFALVVDETVCFTPGLNAITGESGSGKSVLVEALSLITGASASHECIRAPATCATVEGTYALNASTATVARSLLAAAGLPGKALPEAGHPCSLLVKREIIQVQSGSSGAADSGALRYTDGGLTRSRCYINGVATSQRLLRELGAMLIDANIQNSALALKEGAMQLQLLDQVAGTVQLAALVRQMVKRAAQLEEDLSQLDELADEDERRRMEELKESVSRLKVEPNEELHLRQALKNMESRRASAEQCGSIRTAMAGEPGAGGGLTQAVRALEIQLSLLMKQEQQMAAAERAARAGDADEDDEGEDEVEDDEGEAAQRRRGTTAAEAALDALSQARDCLSEAEQQVKAFARSIQFDPAEHHRISERLKSVDKLMRAHNCRSTVQLLQSAKECDRQLQAFYEAEEHQDEWEKELEQLQAQLQVNVPELSRRRQEAAMRLGSGVEAGLRELSMASSRFSVRISRRTSSEELAVSEGLFLSASEPSTDTAAQAPSSSHSPNTAAPGSRWCYFAPGDDGVDVVEFLLSAGPGEPLRPLAAVASGGESARVMLALKAAPSLAIAEAGTEADSHPQQACLGTPVLILDELDSSIGSRLGSVVGRMLRRICSTPQPVSNQVICVTHLPQVACYADQHLRVKKQAASDGRVATVFEPLSTAEQRTEEVAVMLGLEYDVAAEMMAVARTN